MALNDIIRAAEIIQDQKTVAVNPDFLEIWSKLCDNLTTEEFNALYYAMEHSSFPEETVLARQGGGRPVLYFINHGQVKLYYNDNNAEVLIKVAHQGQVIGMDTFFDASVWTMSAVALSNVQVSSLHLKKTKNWPVEFPAVTSKLHDFCKEFNDLGKHLTKLNKSRRDHERSVLAGRVSIAILNNDKNNSGIQITGELADISSGGLSCIIRISQKKNARILLGRNATIHVSSTTAQGKIFQINGILVNVKSLYSMNNEYSAHVKFGRKLTREELAGIIEAGAAFAH
jgi:signal-transduction protein with cAMP-binding, CBS, and nucleotidyltransferase domain